MNTFLSGLTATLVVIVVTYIIFWCTASLTFTPNDKVNHKWFGYIYKPTEITHEGKIYYSLRIYRWWGLIPTKLYITGGNYKEWEVYQFENPSQVSNRAKTSVGKLEALIKELAKDTWSFTSKTKSIEEMKMDNLLED